MPALCAQKNWWYPTELMLSNNDPLAHLLPDSQIYHYPPPTFTNAPPRLQSPAKRGRTPIALELTSDVECMTTGTPLPGPPGDTPPISTPPISTPPLSPLPFTTEPPADAEVPSPEKPNDEALTQAEREAFQSLEDLLHCDEKMVCTLEDMIDIMNEAELDNFYGDGK